MLCADIGLVKLGWRSDLQTTTGSACAQPNELRQSTGTPAVSSTVGEQTHSSRQLGGNPGASTSRSAFGHTLPSPFPGVSCPRSGIV